MHFLGFVVFNQISNDFLSDVERTYYGSKRSYVGRPDGAKRFKTLRRAFESIRDSSRYSEMIVLRLYEDAKKYYLIKP